MKHNSIALTLICATFMPHVSGALAATSPNTPPPGFTALFNGTDLSGWWGAETEDPRKYLALPADELKTKHDASLPDNYEEVTVSGSTLKVELNGTKILDADLSKVTEFMAQKSHPGRDLKSGHFGLAGHSDPVSFRNISIKPLK